MCTDLGLGGEWAAKVAFEIRWKLLQHRKVTGVRDALVHARLIPTAGYSYQEGKSSETTSLSDRRVEFRHDRQGIPDVQ